VSSCSHSRLLNLFVHLHEFYYERLRKPIHICNSCSVHNKTLRKWIPYIFPISLLSRLSTNIVFMCSFYTVLLWCRGFLFSFDLYNIGRAPWTSERPVASPQTSTRKSLNGFLLNWIFRSFTNIRQHDSILAKFNNNNCRLLISAFLLAYSSALRIKNICSSETSCSLQTWWSCNSWNRTIHFHRRGKLRSKIEEWLVENLSRNGNCHIYPLYFQMILH
jgi:hypothetical protein